jgi:hypothetical protein
MKGPTPTEEQVYQEFERRQQAVNQDIEDSYQEKLAEKNKAV